MSCVAAGRRAAGRRRNCSSSWPMASCAGWSDFDGRDVAEGDRGIDGGPSPGAIIDSGSARRDTARLLAEALDLRGSDRTDFETAARGRVLNPTAEVPSWLETGYSLRPDIAAFRGWQEELGAALSLAPPVGRRDEQRPLRGREELLEDLVSSGQGARVVVAHGMGGCGKTSLALEVACRAQERGADVWWVTAADGGRLAAEMRALGRRLGLTDDDLRRSEAADLVWHRLSGWRRDWSAPVTDETADQRCRRGLTLPACTSLSSRQSDMGCNEKAATPLNISSFTIKENAIINSRASGTKAMYTSHGLPAFCCLATQRLTGGILRASSRALHAVSWNSR